MPLSRRGHKGRAHAHGAEEKGGLAVVKDDHGRRGVMSAVVVVVVTTGRRLAIRAIESSALRAVFSS